MTQRENYFELLKKLIHFILIVIFIYSVALLVEKLVSEDTTLITSHRENAIRFPTFTICPKLSSSLMTLESQNKQFEDLNGMIEAAKDSFSASLQVEGSNQLPSWYGGETVDLKSPEDLIIYFNATLDGIWSFVPMMDFYPPFPVHVCAQLYIPIKRLESSMQAMVKIHVKHNESIDYVLIEKEDHWMSRHNTQIDWNKDYGMVSPNVKSTSRLSMTVKERMNTKMYQCDDTNSREPQNCVDDLIMKKLQCRPSWMIKSKSLNTCSGSQKLQEYLALSKDLVMNTSLSKDCYVPNCEEATWKLTSNKEVENGSPNITTMQYFIPQDSKVLGLTEVKLYTWTNLFADFGGFLGLFLGDSILSVSHLILGFIFCKLCKK